MLAAGAVLAACCLRLRSPLEFLLAAYVLGWTWLVALALALSPAELLTRGSLLTALAVGLALALAVWLRLGRPPPPPFRPALAATREALRDPAVLVLTIAVALGAAYSALVAFLVPANEWDALSYHLARASFWRQEEGLGYIADAADPRLNAFPPNAEIGQLATMLLSGSDRYVALGQLLAYAALVLCVAALARRIGLGTREALFAALAFATLPVVALEASGAINDLVVASFLAAAAVFALGSGSAQDRNSRVRIPVAQKPGWGRTSLVLFALAVGLAVGTKFTGLFALPLLALVAAVGSPPRRWPSLLVAGGAGVALGSVWYLVNLAETGRLDGGAGDELAQRQDLGFAPVATTALRLALSFVDMAGAPWPRSLLLLLPACLLLALALARVELSYLFAAVLTAGVLLSPLLWDVGERVFYKAGLLVGTSGDVLSNMFLALNTRADAGFAWYGPLGLLLLVAGALVVLARRERGLPLVLAAAPWVLLLTLALTIVWDPFRGRFLVFGVALAAVTWGYLLRSTAFAATTAAVGSTMLFLTLASYEGKPSGLFSERSVWGNARWDAQSRLDGPAEVFRFVEERVPETSRLAVIGGIDYPLHPFFGERLSRHVSFVGARGPAPDADWLVIDTRSEARRCPEAWRPELVVIGYRVERRVGHDRCLGLSAMR